MYWYIYKHISLCLSTQGGVQKEGGLLPDDTNQRLELIFFNTSLAGSAVKEEEEKFTFEINHDGKDKCTHTHTWLQFSLASLHQPRTPMFSPR